MKYLERPLLHSLRNREERGPVPRAWEYAATKRGHASLVLNSTKLFKRVHKDAVTWLDLDHVENRYLLSGATDASIAIFDTQQDPQQGQPEAEHDGEAPEPELRPVLLMDRRTAGSTATRHKFLVSCVCWYPVDTGLFVTGSYDRTIKVWDTNCQELVSNFEFPEPGASAPSLCCCPPCSQELVSNFEFPERVTSLSMSRVATSHCLIAGACQQQHIRLADPASGAFTHTLSGHREAVWSVCWSFRSEFELVSGDCHGQLRVWDIRRSGCVRVLDQYCTTAAAAAAAARTRLGDALGPGRGPAAEAAARARAAGSVRPPSQGQALRQTLQQGLGVKRPRPSPPPSGAPCNAADAPQRAHLGAVTCVAPTPDGLHWLSAGTDSRLRLWDAWSWHNELVSFPDTRNRGTRAKLLAVSEDGRAVFHPCEHDIQVFDLKTGQLINLLRQGHYGAVTCCVYGSGTSELYSGGEDGQILVWSPGGNMDQD